MIMSYKDIVDHYENCYKQHGDSHLGVDWPDKADADTRYRIMTEGVEYCGGDSILDFGCGLAHYYEYLVKQDKNYYYEGLELSKPMFNRCIQKHPLTTFYNTDIVQEQWTLPKLDCAVMNGVFTEKLTLSHDEMFEYMTNLVSLVFNNVNKGIMFNVMSKQVDYERDDLFHLSVDKLSWFIKDQLSRKFVIRHDYDLWDYTVYILK